MTQPTTDPVEQAAAERMDDSVPTQGYQTTPLVGLGGSAGAIPALQEFFKAMPADSGMAFVVVMHLAPEHESTLPELLQRCTAMPVFQAAQQQAVEPNQVYVIPPGKILGTLEGHLTLADPKPLARGRHVAVDLFFRALADTQGSARGRRRAVGRGWRRCHRHQAHQGARRPDRGAGTGGSRAPQHAALGHRHRPR